MGGTGNDYLKAGAGNTVLYGSSLGNSELNESDTLVGGVGNVTMHGQGGNDTLIAGNATSLMYGGSGNDFLYGNANEWLWSESEAFLFGGTGNDTLFAKGGKNSFYGNEGNDRLSYEAWVSDVTLKVSGLRESGRTSGLKNHLVATDLEIFSMGSGNDIFYGTTMPTSSMATMVMILPTRWAATIPGGR